MNEAHFSWEDLATVTGGVWLRPPSRGTAGVTGVWDDSRTVRSGQLFFAIRGKLADGHRFIESAVRQGAAAVCLERLPDCWRPPHVDTPPVPCLQVADALTAFQRLARAHRLRFPGTRIAGLTGSCGKTSTKEILRTILEAHWPDTVLTTEGNTNNHFGVPRNLLRFRPGLDAAVLELGTNHPGEIRHLTDLVLPHVGAICHVGRAHTEHLGGTEAVAREKAALLAGTAADGTAVFPADGRHTDILRAAAGNRRTLTFGESADADVMVTYLGSNPEPRIRLEWRQDGTVRKLTWAVPGQHQARNAACAAATATALGLPPAEIAEALPHARLPHMRMEEVDIGGIHWLNDAYNANPDSVLAALTWFAESTAGTTPDRRTVVLGDMLELGDTEAADHCEVLEAARRRFPDTLIATVGARMAAAIEATGVRALAFDTARDAGNVLRDMIAPGTWVLLKASRGIGLEQILSSITQRRESANESA